MTLDELLRPFEYQFFQHGLVVATVAGALCGLIGVYVVLRSMSYIGHGLSHAIFGGFAPFICTWLIQLTGSTLAPGFYMVAAAVITFLVTLRIRETDFEPLR